MPTPVPGFDSLPPVDSLSLAVFAASPSGNRVAGLGSHVSPFVGLLSALRNRLAEAGNPVTAASIAHPAAGSSIPEFIRLISESVGRISEAGSRVTVGKFDSSAAGNAHLPFVGLIVNSENHRSEFGNRLSVLRLAASTHL